jgi:Lon protease-like protein
VLRSLETHPHVQRMGLNVDYADAWQVAYTLVQLLPLEESVKYELLGADSIDELIRELDIILNEISGED